MGRPREPVKLIEAKGKSHHLTKEDKKEREQQEVPVVAENIRPPGFLTTRKQEEKFTEIANALQAMGIMSDADCDVLGRYICCQDDWLKYGKLVKGVTNKLEKLVKKSLAAVDEKEEAAIENRIEIYTAHLKDYENLRSKAFAKCQECAGLLGMTITSRGKIVMQKKDEKPKENKFSQFMGA